MGSSATDDDNDYDYGVDDTTEILTGEPVYRDSDDASGDDGDYQESGSGSTKCGRFVRALFLKSVLFLALQLFMILTLRFEIGWGVRGPLGWFLFAEVGLFFAYFIVEGICAPCCLKICRRKRKRKKRSWKSMVSLLIIIHCLNVPLIQVAFGLFVPSESLLLPVETFSTDLINMEADNWCFLREYNLAKNFYKIVLNNQRDEEDKNTGKPSSRVVVDSCEKETPSRLETVI